ncbi:MAG TPA: hypothetical protein VMC05_02805 [Xanthobacteraceae bacterium]|nr:hypothetical protein [Xanthobacteraceae bacterium]
MRMMLFSAVAGGLLLAAQGPALAQGAFAFPPNGLDYTAPTQTPAPAKRTLGHTGRYSGYYDYDGQYARTPGWYAAPSHSDVPGNLQIGR